MLTIKDIEKWDGIETLDDISALGVNPLIDWTKMIDEQIFEYDLDLKGELITLNRMLYSGLKDVETALKNLRHSYSKNKKKDTRHKQCWGKRFRPNHRT